MKRLGFFVALLATPVAAHDYWVNGVAVPAWVKASCCGPADAHLLAPDQVWHDDRGWHIVGTHLTIPDNLVLPSQDSQIWAFYLDVPDPPSCYCLFLPMPA